MSQGVPNGQIACFTARKLAQIQCQAGESSFRSTLAHLRQGIGRVPGDMPQLWGFFLSEMPEKWMGNSEPSKAEWAIYLALTLFALHQQGQDPNTAWMSQPGASLGKAVARLIESPEDEKRISRRFFALATASSMEELAQHIRSLVQLLRSKSIPLDYPALAENLYWYQHTNSQAQVRLRWGQDFYYHTQIKQNDNDKEAVKDE